LYLHTSKWPWLTNWKNASSSNCVCCNGIVEQQVYIVKSILLEMKHFFIWKWGSSYFQNAEVWWIEMYSFQTCNDNNVQFQFLSNTNWIFDVSISNICYVAYQTSQIAVHVDQCIEKWTREWMNEIARVAPFPFNWRLKMSLVSRRVFR